MVDAGALLAMVRSALALTVVWVLFEALFEVLPSATNFLFVRPPAAHSAGGVYERLRERRILVRHYHREPIDGWFRITIGTREQHRALLAALEEILG